MQREESEKFIRWCIPGAVGCFLYCFLVKALNADFEPKYKRVKAAPRNSARSLRQDFYPNSKFGKRRNTVCISRFSN